MPVSAEEIRRRLGEFAARWGRYSGSERAEAQTFLNDDIAEDPSQQPRRFVIDFAVTALEEAMSYPAALETLRERVKPEREQNKDRFRRENWWLLGRPVLSMRPQTCQGEEPVRPGARAALASERSLRRPAADTMG